MVKVSSMQSKGRSVPNQFIIETDNGDYFQSYDSIIAFMPSELGCNLEGSRTQLDETYWNYSRTTSKYRNIFLNETTKETQAKINSGEYVLTNLN